MLCYESQCETKWGSKCKMDLNVRKDMSVNARLIAKMRKGIWGWVPKQIQKWTIDQHHSALITFRVALLILAHTRLPYLTFIKHRCIHAAIAGVRSIKILHLCHSKLLWLLLSLSSWAQATSMCRFWPCLAQSLLSSAVLAELLSFKPVRIDSALSLLRGARQILDTTGIDPCTLAWVHLEVPQRTNRFRSEWIDKKEIDRQR